MRPYIEDREGNKYEFRRLTRREKLNLAKNASEMENASDEEKIKLMMNYFMQYFKPFQV